MKLARADVVNLSNLLSTVAIAGIDSIVIDTDGVASGWKSGQTVFISSVGVPALPQKMGLSRLSLLRSRLELFANNPDVVLDAKESDRGEIVQLEVSAGKSKVQFRCTATSMIKAPKSMADEACRLITIKKDQLQLILNGIKVMGAEMVTLIIKQDNQIVIEAADSNNDRITVELADKAEQLCEPEEEGTTVFQYVSDLFLTLLRAAQTDDGVSFTVGVQGTMMLIVHGHSLYILQHVDGE